MHSALLTDEINIVSIANDEWGKETILTSCAIRARVAERNKLIKDRDGKEVISSIQVIVKSGTIVKYDSRIIIKKLCANAYILPNKKWQIKQISYGHMFRADCIELWLGD